MMPRARRIYAWLAWSLALVALPGSAQEWVVRVDSPDGKGTHLRSGPHTNYRPLLFVPNGAALDVLPEAPWTLGGWDEPGWVKVRHAGREGFVEGVYLLTDEGWRLDPARPPSQLAAMRAVGVSPPGPIRAGAPPPDAQLTRGGSADTSGAESGRAADPSGPSQLREASATGETASTGTPSGCRHPAAAPGQPAIVFRLGTRVCFAARMHECAADAAGAPGWRPRDDCDRYPELLNLD